MSRPVLVRLILVLCVLISALGCGGTDGDGGGGSGGGGSGGGGGTVQPQCPAGCAANQYCFQTNVCACMPGYLDCASEVPGCETAGTVCPCVYEGDAGFCARHGADCGNLQDEDNCGLSRTVGCGSCGDGEVCGVEIANVCAPEACTPETDEAFCTRLGAECGEVTADDRCGDPKTAGCGECDDNETCNANHRCETRKLGEREYCVVDGQSMGTCETGLKCLALDGQTSMCIRTCYTSADCPGQECAEGFLASGEGICGEFRSEGESCHFETQGPDFCWDPGQIDDSWFSCLNGTCRYICQVNGYQETGCPAGYGCGSEWRQFTDYQTTVRICEEASGVPERGFCSENGQPFAACATGLSCIDFGAYGVCLRACYSNGDCPGGQTCAAGLLTDGGGICGYPRVAGQTCHLMEVGADFCFNPADTAGQWLACLGGVCRYACDYYSSTTYPTWDCPAGQSCGGTYTAYPEYLDSIAICR